MNQTGRILEEVKKAVCGKDHVLVWVLTVLLARGHVLLEDIPGVGKTTMALAFSRALGLEYGRVQFTPDVLPSDITGYSVYQKETGKLVYQPGAVLCNLFLADELNRATSRTQSALLEAMEEGQVTVDGVSHPIPQPFIVFATQNPTGAAGTQLLPDSQMDRFTVRLSIGYPAPEDERNMVLARQGVNPLQTVCQVLSRDELDQVVALVLDHLGDPDYVGIGLLLGTGLEAKQVAALRYGDIYEDPDNKGSLILDYHQPELSGSMHDFSFVLSTFAAHIYCKRRKMLEGKCLSPEEIADRCIVTNSEES